jgi:ADP-ribosylglycohydrolase
MGAPAEGLRRGEFAPITGYRSGGPHNLDAGQWTDDTSLALCLAESLIKKAGFDAKDQMERYLRWYRSGYLSSTGEAFGYGATTRKALERFAAWGMPYVGDSSDQSASNGSLMRIAPIPLFFRHDPVAALRYARDSSRTTHANIVVLEACQYLTALMIKALNGADKKEVLFGDLSSFPAFEGRSSLEDFANHLRPVWCRSRAEDLEPSAYVLDTLTCALWALHESETFEEGLLMAVSLGGDTDTVGAVYGQLAGAIYGSSAIPQPWFMNLHLSSLILVNAEELFISDRRACASSHATLEFN